MFLATCNQVLTFLQQTSIHWDSLELWADNSQVCRERIKDIRFTHKQVLQRLNDCLRTTSFMTLILSQTLGHTTHLDSLILYFSCLLDCSSFLSWCWGWRGWDVFWASEPILSLPNDCLALVLVTFGSLSLSEGAGRWPLLVGICWAEWMNGRMKVCLQWLRFP